jgi:hypothetical protein
MEATTDHHHHEMPTEGAALTAVAISATLHCLTGCAIGGLALSAKRAPATRTGALRAR